jgi:tetratricopeptide (TPR) repeat protein
VNALASALDANLTASLFKGQRYNAFLSHNAAEKFLVEPLAYKLSQGLRTHRTRKFVMHVFRIYLAMTMTLYPLRAVSYAEAQQAEPTQETAFVTLANEAYALHVKGKNEEAIALAERAERAGSADALPQTDQVAQAWNSLGVVLFELRYDDRARRAYEKAFTLVNAISSPDETLRSNLLNNLGQVEDRLGNSEKAREYLEACVALRQKSKGTTLHSLALAIDNLALVYDHVSNLDKAEELHQKALEIFEREGDIVNSDAATTAGNLAVYFRLKRDYRRAESYQLRALDTHQRLFGLEHEATLIDVTNLAQLYLEVGDEARIRFYVRSCRVG